MIKNVLKDTNLILIENNFFPLHSPPHPYTAHTFPPIPDSLFNTA